MGPERLLSATKETKKRLLELKRRSDQARRGSPARLKWVSGHELPLVALVVVILEARLVLVHLPVQLVNQFIHGGVQIFMGAFCK